MQNKMRSHAFLVRAALCAALIAAGGSAFAAPTEKVLYSFTGGADGGYPFAGLIADGRGNLYGTTLYGGTLGAGTVFKLSPGTFFAAPTETVLYSFTGGADGGSPEGGLIFDSSGNLYGTTEGGGLDGPCLGFDNGCGTVFKLTPGGTETVLFTFFITITGFESGILPYAGLIADSSGNLYGTTSKGGGFVLGGCVAFGCGTVFKVAPGGTETMLYSFTGGADGALPYAGLIADSAGNLYGTTEGGGASGQGTVFKLSPGTETVLHSFTGGADGAGPEAGLIFDSSGNLYGTTQYGGAPGSGCGGYGCGTVFKLSPGGTETVLHSFTGGSDGANPSAGLLADRAGNLYGTTQYGGASNAGVVFKLAGAVTVRHLHD